MSNFEEELNKLLYEGIEPEVFALRSKTAPETVCKIRKVNYGKTKRKSKK